jgi:hypothetical protein
MSFDQRVEYAHGGSAAALRGLARMSGQPLQHLVELAQRGELITLFRGKSKGLPPRTFRHEPVPATPHLALIALWRKRFGPS